MSEERLSRIEELIIALSGNLSNFRSYVEHRFDELETRIKTIELDVEPEGRISEAFEHLSNDIDSLEKRLTRLEQRLEHGQNQMRATLDLIVRRITGYEQQENQE
ncbi:hypothetical protein PCC7424_2786 [Gloeothece citriformis PCC 7424]|uniref:Uncharacterized protein n=1 Tax=Gloeothece citriformis (strain PCC 7424) TaxID=65393 RepID=B7K8J8_GLOC7|nr:hypothetical protein [Gloeothece citriformis]ACK71196.1 hypothetical protein PCC7424_2786 [Gloeothece citriformis PCC 7424]